MCILCDGKRDMRLLDVALEIFNEVDFDRARGVAMSSVLTDHVVDTQLRPYVSDDTGKWVNISDLISEEDPEAYAVVTMMMLLDAAQEFFEEVGKIIDERGFVAVPATESELPEAFDSIIDTIFPEGDDLHGSEDDDEREV